MKTLAALIAIPSCAAAHGIAECSRIFEAEISDGVIHGAAVMAGGLDGDKVSASWGWADAAHTIPMTTHTVIDVASVTKAAAGVTAYLIAHSKGLVDFDVPFTNYLSSCSAVQTGLKARGRSAGSRSARIFRKRFSARRSSILDGADRQCCST